MGNVNLASIYNYNKLENIGEIIEEDCSGPYVHPSINNFDKEIKEYFKDKSLIENTLSKMKIFKDYPCLGRRLKLGETKDGKNILDNKYTYYTQGEINKMSLAMAKNLHALRKDLIHEDEYMNNKIDLIGIFAKNCCEWVISDIACQLESITTATLYATLGPESFKFICNQTCIKTIFVSPDLVDSVCKFKERFSLEQLKNVILFDLTTNCDTNKEFEKLKKCGFNCYSFKNDFIKENNNIQDSDLKISEPDTVMTICYTSGTTGDPKGVMLTQRNMRCVLETVIKDSAVPMNEKGSHFSYLPLAHIFERMVISGCMNIAAKVGFISGKVKDTLLEDIKYCGPIMLCTVPKVLQTIRTKIFDTFNELGGWKKRLAYKAYEIKKKNFKKYGVLTHAFYDRIVFNQIRKMMGNEIKVILCASAPMPKDLADDIKLFLSIPIIEGLGMTELGGSAFCTNYVEHTNVTAGGVTTGAKMKLKSHPELGYTTKDNIDGVICPAGELCLKGPLVFIGYYKNDKETKSAFDESGYFHTGDIGRIFPYYGNGLKIVDRVKEIFKLSQGEYIIPAKLESIYGKSNLINQIMIYGNSSKNRIIGIIYPDKNHCIKALGVTEEEYKNMEDDERLKKIIIDDLLKLAEENDFNGLEKVKNVLLTLEGFTLENGCLTPTSKIVRKKVEIKFKDRIDQIYKLTE